MQKNIFFDQARATISFQLFEESRNDRLFGDDNLRVRTEQVDMYSVSLDFDKEIKATKLYYGVDYYYNDISSSAFNENIETGEIERTESRYPDGGSSFSSFAIYGSLAHPLSKRIFLNSGLRFNAISLIANTLDEQALTSNAGEIDLNNSAINGSLGLAINMNTISKISYNISTGFRAPNVDDVGKVFDVGNSLIVPNPDLKPEYSISNELAYQRKKDGSLFKIVGFYSRLFNSIVDGAFELNGSSFVTFQGESLDVFAKVNSGKAHIYGGSLIYHIEFLNNWAFSKTISYTGGYDISSDEPLRHTTPIFGKATITYQKNKLRTELYTEYNTDRDPDQIPSSEFERKPYLYTENGTPGWYTLNVTSSYRISDRIDLNIALENILDKHYRPYTSGISAPGRNLLVAFRASF